MALKQFAKSNLASDKQITAEVSIMDFIDSSGSSTGFIERQDTSTDYWLVFELGGKSLGYLLFQLNGDFLKGERIYSIKKGKIMHDFIEKPSVLLGFLRRMLEMIASLSNIGVIHSDIKPENILVEDEKIEQIRLIDYGSAVIHKECSSLLSNTPEYMPPEINKNAGSLLGKSKTLEIIRSMPTHSIDTWSLGMVLLEIVVGCPLWMGYKTKMKRRGKVSF